MSLARLRGMHVTARNSLVENARHRMRERVSVHPIVQQRVMTAAALTLLTVVLGVALVVTLGPDVLAVYLPTLPFALLLLWASTTSLRFDDYTLTDRDETAGPDVKRSPEAESPAARPAHGFA